MPRQLIAEPQREPVASTLDTSLISNILFISFLDCDSIIGDCLFLVVSHGRNQSCDFHRCQGLNPGNDAADAYHKGGHLTFSLDLGELLLDGGLIAEGLLWTTLKGHLIRAFIRLVAELFSRPGKKQLIIASDNRAPFYKGGGPSGSHASLI